MVTHSFLCISLMNVVSINKINRCNIERTALCQHCISVNPHDSINKTEFSDLPGVTELVSSIAELFS